MYICSELHTETWQPDFSSSGQTSPMWTRVTCRGLEITNSLGSVEWTNPVQVVLCEACGHEQCATGGYVHVSRFGPYVLWSAPQSDEREGLHVLRRLGALAIPIAKWDDWASTTRGLPRSNALVAANHAAVADAWVLGPGRSTPSIVSFLADRLVGGDTLEKEEAIALVEQTLMFLRANEKTPFDEPLVSLAETGARLETLYFDAPAELDWPAFAFAGRDTYIVLDREHATRAPT